MLSKPQAKSKQTPDIEPEPLKRTTGIAFASIFYFASGIYYLAFPILTQDLTDPLVGNRSTLDNNWILADQNSQRGPLAWSIAIPRASRHTRLRIPSRVQCCGRPDEPARRYLPRLTNRPDLLRVGNLPGIT